MSSDIQKLRRLAQAALVAPDGLSAEWMDRLGQFQESVSPAAFIELLDRLEAADRAWKESDKSCWDLTEKVIPNIREQLESAERERDALRAKIEAMEQQEPAGTLHDDGYFVWRRGCHPYESNYVGWMMKLYALPGAKGE